MLQDSMSHFGMKIFECKQGLNIHLSSTRSGIGKIWPKFPLLALAIGMHRVTSVTLGDHTGILWWLAGQGSRASTGSETWKCQRSVFLSGQSLEIDMWVNEACTRTYCTYYYRVRKPSRAQELISSYCVCVASLPQTIYWLQTLVALNTVVQLAAHRACPWPGITNDAFRSTLMTSVYGPGPSIHSHMFD